MSFQQVRDELSDLDEGDIYQTALADEQLPGKETQQQTEGGDSVQNGVMKAEKLQPENGEETLKQPSKIVTQLKASSNKIASYVKETTGAVKAGVAQIDFSMEREAIKSLKISTLDALSNMSQKAADSGSWVWQAGKSAAAATGQRIKRATVRQQTLSAICKQEASNRPCPRLLMCCANALVASGLKEKDLFHETVPYEQLEMLFEPFENGTAILPPNTQPHQIAELLKQFLSNLPEPILTYKYVSELTSSNTPLDRSIFILSQLPAPNAACVQLLLELFFYVQKNQKCNGMDVGRLAVAVSNCLLWKPIQKTPRPAADSVSETSDDSSVNQQKVNLSLEESKAFETVLSHWISNYYHIYFNTLDGPISKSNSDAPLSKDNSETSSIQQGGE